MTAAITHIIELSEAPGRVPLAGAEMHLVSLMKAQRAAGASVSLVVLLGDVGPAIRSAIEHLHEHGVDVVVLRSPRPQLRAARAAVRVAVAVPLLRLLRQRRDHVVHTHLLLASTIGRVAAAVAGCRTIVESTHNDEPAFRTRLGRLRVRALDALTSHHIAITVAVAERLHAAGVSPDRISVVRYGVEVPEAEAARDELRRRLGLPADAFVVGFTGRLTAQKDVSTFIKAVARTPRAVGVVLGAGEEEVALRREAQRLAADVRFLGYRPDAAEISRAFDVFVLPSRWEGLGLVLLEAMARSVPVVASDLPPVREILAGGKYGVLVAPGDADGFAAAIGRLREHPGERVALGARAAAIASRCFTVERMVAETERAYVIARARGRTRRRRP